MFYGKTTRAFRSCRERSIVCGHDNRGGHDFSILSWNRRDRIDRNGTPKAEKVFLIVATCIFMVAAGAQLFRALVVYPFDFYGTAIPVWVSWVSFAIFATLAGFCLATSAAR